MIQTKRLNLRALEPEDAVHYYAWINDRETNFWRGLYHPTSMAEAQVWIAETGAKSFTQLSLTLVDLSSANPIGFIGLRSICPRSRRAEVWIYIGDRKFWNRGLATEAVAALVQYAFDEMNLHRLWLETDPEHKAAVRCYEKIGFVREGLLRDGYYRRGQYRDTCVMGLIRSPVVG